MSEREAASQAEFIPYDVVDAQFAEGVARASERDFTYHDQLHTIDRLIIREEASIKAALRVGGKRVLATFHDLACLRLTQTLLVGIGNAGERRVSAFLRGETPRRR